MERVTLDERIWAAVNALEDASNWLSKGESEQVYASLEDARAIVALALEDALVSDSEPTDS